MPWGIFSPAVVAVDAAVVCNAVKVFASLVSAVGLTRFQRRYSHRARVGSLSCGGVGRVAISAPS